MEGNVLFALGLTLFAGLSTGIGSAMAFFTKTTNTRFLSAALGFSAGVMIYVSFTEILGKSFELLRDSYGLAPGSWYAVLSFFGGILVIAIIDLLVHTFENHHEIKRVEDMKLHTEEKKKSGLLRMGSFMALAIAITILHTFLKQAGRDEFAYLALLVGLAIGLIKILPLLQELFTGVQEVFKLYD